MFFDMDLLSRQRKGKFALIWLASTRGLPFLKKLEIKKVRITHICDEILIYVMSNSSSTSNRLSLYLAAKLMWGTILIYQQQVKYLEGETLFFSLRIRRRSFKFGVIDDDEEVKPKRKQTKKSVKVRQLTPEQELQNIEEQMLQTLPDATANVTDVIHITLRDEVSTRIHQNEPDLFGDEGQVEQQVAPVQLDDDIWPCHPDPEPHPIPPMTDADNRQVTSVEDVAPSPSKRRRLEPCHLFPVVNVQETGSISPSTPRRVMLPPASPVTPSRVMPPPASPRILRSRTRLSSGEMRKNLRESSVRPPVRARKGLSMEFSVITPSRWEHDAIHRADRIAQTPLLSPRKVNPKEIIAEILCGISYSDDDFISVVRDINETLSLNCEIPELRMASERHARTLDPVAGLELTVPTEVKLPQTLPPVETLQEAPLIPSPRFSRIPMVVDPKPEINQGPAEISEVLEVEQHIPRVHTSTPISQETEAKRLNALLQQIRDRFLENGNQPLTLKELCRPLNRVIVARTFNALLHLQAQRYVKLENEENSVALARICPGQRI